MRTDRHDQLYMRSFRPHRAKNAKKTWFHCHIFHYQKSLHMCLVHKFFISHHTKYDTMKSKVFRDGMSLFHVLETTALMKAECVTNVQNTGFIILLPSQVRMSAMLESSKSYI
jgi:hypothetical protein